MYYLHRYSQNKHSCAITSVRQNSSAKNQPCSPSAYTRTGRSVGGGFGGGYCGAACASGVSVGSQASAALVKARSTGVLWSAKAGASSTAWSARACVFLRFTMVGTAGARLGETAWDPGLAGSRTWWKETRPGVGCPPGLPEWDAGASRWASPRVPRSRPRSPKSNAPPHVPGGGEP